MESFRKWFYKPKKDDPSLLAQFFYADDALNMVAAELDSFDGRKDPERCSTLVNHLRQAQDKVLNICHRIMDEVIPYERANRDFRAKFPDDVMQDNLAGQLWFGAECLAAGSSIMNRETESAAMRPLAKALTKSLENVRNLLREQCLRGNYATLVGDVYTERLQEALKIFDRLFAEFELCYVSAMVPVKTPREYELQQLVVVLFSETLQRALKMNLLNQEMVDDYDPALMFTIPRLAIVGGLIIFPDGPLCPDNSGENMSEMFRPFRTLLHKIRELLWSLSKKELYTLEKLLCSSEDPGDYQNKQFNEGEMKIKPKMNVTSAYQQVLDPEDFVTEFYVDYPACKEFVSEFCSNMESTDLIESEDESELHTENSECETVMEVPSNKIRIEVPRSGTSQLQNGMIKNECIIESHVINEKQTKFPTNNSETCNDVTEHHTNLVSDEPVSNENNITGYLISNRVCNDVLLSSEMHSSLLQEIEDDDSNLDMQAMSDVSETLTFLLQGTSAGISGKSDTISHESRDSLQTSSTAEESSNQLNHNSLCATNIEFNDQATSCHCNIRKNNAAHSEKKDCDNLNCENVHNINNESSLCNYENNVVNHSANCCHVPKSCTNDCALCLENLNGLKSLPESHLCSTPKSNNNSHECCRVNVANSIKPEISEDTNELEGHSTSVKHPHTPNGNSSSTSSEDGCCTLCLQSRSTSQNNHNCSLHSSYRNNWESLMAQKPTSSKSFASKNIDMKVSQDSVTEENSVAPPTLKTLHRTNCIIAPSGASNMPRISEVLIGSFSSTCSSCQSSVSVTSDSHSISSDTSSFNSECQDDEEIALAMQAAEIANRNEKRSKFGSTENLIHRLFVCIAGVADQLQTNFAGDLRNILKAVFLMSASTPEPESGEGGSPTGSNDSSSRIIDSAEEALLVGWEPSNSPGEPASPPPWVPDDMAPRCMSCESVFTVVRRRHHCRNCGKVFCARCSSNSVPLPRYGHVKPVRVCNRCFLYQVTPFTLEELATRS